MYIYPIFRSEDNLLMKISPKTFNNLLSIRATMKFILRFTDLMRYNYSITSYNVIVVVTLGLCNSKATRVYIFLFAYRAIMEIHSSESLCSPQSGGEAILDFVMRKYQNNNY